MTYPDNSPLTAEESRFLAKKKWDENVYCGMKMENRAVTFPQTKTILDGINVPDVRLDDIQAILNMRDAWRFQLEHMSDPVTLDYLCRLNGFVARNEALSWGVLRAGRVAISGTDFLPPVPTPETVEAELSAILTGTSSATDKALEAFCWRPRAVLLGRQQAHQPSPGQQAAAVRRCRYAHHHRKAHGAVQHPSVGLL